MRTSNFVDHHADLRPLRQLIDGLERYRSERAVKKERVDVGADLVKRNIRRRQLGWVTGSETGDKRRPVVLQPVKEGIAIGNHLLERPTGQSDIRSQHLHDVRVELRREPDALRVLLAKKPKGIGGCLCELRSAAEDGSQHEGLRAPVPELAAIMGDVDVVQGIEQGAVESLNYRVRELRKDVGEPESWQASPCSQQVKRKSTQVVLF
jgi:hypothetical protein